MENEKIIYDDKGVKIIIEDDEDLVVVISKDDTNTKITIMI